MFWILHAWLEVSAAAATLDESEIAAAITTAQARTTGSFAVLTANGVQERAVIERVPAASGVVFLRAGSPSESWQVMKGADIECGIHLSKNSVGRPREWAASIVGACALQSAAPDMPAAEPSPVASRSARVDDSIRLRRAKTTAALATATSGGLALVGLGGAIVKGVQCEQMAVVFEPCDMDGPSFGASYVTLAAVPLFVSAFEVRRINRIRKHAGLKPLSSANVVLPAFGFVLASFPIYGLDMWSGLGFSVIGTGVGLSAATMAIVHRDEHDGRPHGMGVRMLPNGGAVVEWRGEL